MVRTAKEYIAAGDIYQVVLSQRFEATIDADPFTVYRALRHVNPSPYMYFLRVGDRSIVGSSPEMLVRVEGRQVQTHPIAGTRPRGRTDEEDVRLGEELKRNEKERAEHVMLVDLGRNDIGRVCDVRHGPRADLHDARALLARHAPGVDRRRHSSPSEHDRLDALVACFPAGTVSGAPKVRAMEIIAELENRRRGVYAGAVGYLDFAGNLDFCITIRTVLIENGHAYVQAGAGIVADSNPAAEYEETRDKARAVHARARARAGGLGIRRADQDSRCHGSRHRQLRFVHLQPRAVPRRARRRGARAPQRRGRPSTRSTTMAPEQIVISPGPGRPEDAGISPDVIRRFGPTTPILGVCLGHQAIGMVYGGTVCRATAPMHGKTSTVVHDGKGVFAGIDRAVPGGPLPLARDRGRRRSRRTRGVGAHEGGRHDHGASATAPTRCTASSSIPSRC